MSDLAMWLLALGGALVLLTAVWLRRCQVRFIAELRAADDPLADHPETKTFRQRFQAWLFGLAGADGERVPAKPGGNAMLTLLMVVLLGAIAAYSILPGVFQ